MPLTIINHLSGVRWFRRVQVAGKAFLGLGGDWIGSKVYEVDGIVQTRFDVNWNLGRIPLAHHYFALWSTFRYGRFLPFHCTSFSIDIFKFCKVLMAWKLCLGSPAGCQSLLGRYINRFPSSRYIQTAHILSGSDIGTNSEQLNGMLT